LLLDIYRKKTKLLFRYIFFSKMIEKEYCSFLFVYQGELLIFLHFKYFFMRSHFDVSEFCLYVRFIFSSVLSSRFSRFFFSVIIAFILILVLSFITLPVHHCCCVLSDKKKYIIYINNEKIQTITIERELYFRSDSIFEGLIGNSFFSYMQTIHFCYICLFVQSDSNDTSPRLGHFRTHVSIAIRSWPRSRVEIVGSNFFWTRTRLIKLTWTRTRTRTFYSFKNVLIFSKFFTNLKLSVGLKIQDAFIRLLI
jgi:hypothetical protein